ncbi:hypothetical protein [Paenibacillus alvei]|uniref:hypothetical protein n=1 Tax=Paenibacillus alvei TaxID=44250 RepID=UPI0013DBEB5A|nr:hypothetical protein [Paenibacillus alvei]NEZ45288.1 hypothetical protein [Paenibacillus alvei]
MKRRLRNKYFKRVASGLETGKQIPNFYIDKVRTELTLFFDRKYHSVFQSWWYDHLELQEEMSLSKELERFFVGVRNSFGEMSGIDMKAFEIVSKERLEQKRRVYGPKKLRRRKVKEQPIRKLRQPEQFYIAVKGGRPQIVIGERVFQHRGFHFFIRHVPGMFPMYIVTDVMTGMAVAQHERFKKAVEIAKSRIEGNFESYLTRIKTIKRQQLGEKQS